jgi:RNA polymerase sigma factor (sigma-70 family)
MAEDDVSRWISQLARGDESAAQRIWERYFHRLVILARGQMDGLPRRVVDEEDVALSAMHSCYRRIAAGQYPELKNREDLWRLLVRIVAHKALDQLRFARRVKRGMGHVRGESTFDSPKDASQSRGIEQVLGNEPTPELAALTAETCQQLLAQLDDSLRAVVLYRLEGYSNVEIAEKLGCALRTVERKVALVRQRWEHQGHGM